MHMMLKRMLLWFCEQTWRPCFKARMRWVSFWKKSCVLLSAITSSPTTSTKLPSFMSFRTSFRFACTVLEFTSISTLAYAVQILTPVMTVLYAFALYLSLVTWFVSFFRFRSLSQYLFQLCHQTSDITSWIGYFSYRFSFNVEITPFRRRWFLCSASACITIDYIEVSGIFVPLFKFTAAVMLNPHHCYPHPFAYHSISAFTIYPRGNSISQA